MKRIGPRTEPWGTPQATVAGGTRGRVVAAYGLLPVSQEGGEPAEGSARHAERGVQLAKENVMVDGVEGRGQIQVR